MPPRRKVGFLSDYKLQDAYLLKPDRKAGRPGLIDGFAPNGEPVLVREWLRGTKDNDADLEHIWRHELRQLHRLAGYPGAADCIAHLYDAGEDPKGFYVVVAPGQRQPLQVLLDRSNSSDWLKQARITVNRARIWANLKLLCTGLETLHAQGLLHRNLDAWSVLTAGGVESDFQLTGFEWTMRLSSGEPPRAFAGTKSKQRDSFTRDWLAFGLLAADLLGVKRERLLNPAIVPFELADHVTVAEAKLLRTLVQLIPLASLNGETIAARIDEIERNLAATIANRQAKLILSLRLGHGSQLSDRIRNASDFEIEADDIDAQIAFVTDDLGEEPLLIGVRPKDSSDFRLVLQGRSLLYRLREFRAGASASWEIAYSESVEPQAPAPVNVVGQLTLQPAALEVITLSEAHTRFPRIRGKVQFWDGLAKSFERNIDDSSPEDSVHRALVLLQLIEALYAAADVFPVEVAQIPHQTDEQETDEFRLVLRPRHDPERQALAEALGLQPPQQRFARALEGDVANAESWIYSEARRFGERDTNDTEWQFDRIVAVAGQAPAYAFRGPTPPPNVKDAAIYATSAGRDVQFKRRLKALKALREHRELLSMMADSRKRIVESHDKLPADDSLASLDASKQEALKKIVGTLPLFLVQGPPGVGKTRLVRDLVRRRFLEEPTSRLLLTAQSNFAVDHLMDELAPLIGGGGADEALVVRSSKKDSIEAPTQFDIRLQTTQLAQRIATSPLANRMPLKLRKALMQMATATADGGSAASSDATPAGRGAGQANRVFEGLVARAANVVFATTNSGELERLIDERGQFDWVIVEEAAKATGSELTSPMLLSHRRLMIGDHLQLSPFASQQFDALLSNPEKVRQALTLGEEFIGRSLRDPGTEDLLDDIEDNERELPALCAEALRLLTYFRSTIEAEFKRLSKGRLGRPIAQRLTAQHRMHPAIAALVSRCFYGDLETHPDCAKRFALEAPPYRSTSSVGLPPHPIVVIDVPYVQSSVGQDHGDKEPLWHNPSEVNAAVHALSLLRRNALSSRSPTLAVLSPYGRQVKQLDLAIKGARADQLAHLSEFSAASLGSQLCHTVDSFQGNEADVVVLSLVRNNQHAGVRKALGFLSNPQRMNVALSRARWKLVMITSMEFLNEIVGSSKGTPQEEEIGFLREMLAALKEGQEKGSVARVPLDVLLREGTR